MLGDKELTYYNQYKQCMYNFFIEHNFSDKEARSMALKMYRLACDLASFEDSLKSIDDVFKQMRVDLNEQIHR